MAAVGLLYVRGVLFVNAYYAARQSRAAERGYL